jgi:hypothetical protein
MAKFRDVKTLQKNAALHASIHNHFNQDRHLNRRDIFKQARSVALPSGDNWRPERRDFGCFGDLVRIGLTAP